MKLPKTYFQNLSAAKYREYLKLLPGIEHENTRLFITLALTFGALIFFGIFAINPTLTTISELKKELDDNLLVEQQLQTKIENLSALHQQYLQIEPDLVYVNNAIPQTAQIPLLSAQIAALGQQYGITLTTYRVAQVELANSANKLSKNPSFIFTLQAEGPYDKMMSFSNALANINRIITIESMSIARDQKTNDLVLAIRGREYFKP
jgi:Tfp pilus assembly protein PilO